MPAPLLQRQLDAPPSSPVALEDLFFAKLKVTLLAEGLRIPKPARQVLTERAKPVLRVRSGSCGGLDLMFVDGSYVNAPVHERFARESPLELWPDGGTLHVHDARGRFPDTVVTPVPMPGYYERRDEHGTPLHRIGQLCSDRLGIGLTNICTYWRSSARRCKFCSIGHNVTTEQSRKGLHQIRAVADAAYADPVAPARHLLLGGGTPDGPDSGAIAIAEAAAAVKEAWHQPIYAMLAPPSDLGFLDLLCEHGVDEVGLNMELFSEVAAARLIPGKHGTIGRAGYLAALERAVELFGPVNARSILVVGLEPVEDTLAGVELLASMGVLPILSPFRPLAGTPLERHPTLSAAQLWELTLAASEAAGRHGMPLGPVCIPCQSNTLTVPGDARYRYY